MSLEGLIFNDQQNKCTPQSHIFGCSNHPPPPPPRTPPTTSAPSTVTAHPQTFLYFECNNRDGLFEEGACLNKFFNCSNNIPYRAKCLGNLRFSEKLGHCTWDTTCFKGRASAEFPLALLMKELTKLP
uniref:Chitin-binding type-2 domain-containing protein n=1 Tax=Steinernema glaseri TaxID=37863 RepID=A0A1I7YKT8_9BILA